MANKVVGRCSMCLAPLRVAPGGAEMCVHCDLSSHNALRCQHCRISGPYDGVGPSAYRKAAG